MTATLAQIDAFVITSAVFLALTIAVLVSAFIANAR